jgi:hypothetical protein
MNSLTDLNNWSLVGGISFQDDRPPTLTFTDATVEDYSISVYEGQQFTMSSPIAVDRMYSQTTFPTLTVNTAAVTGSSVAWPVTTPAMYVSSNGSATTLHNIRSGGDWQLVQHPVVTLPAYTPGIYDFTSNFAYNNDANTKIWTHHVTVNSLRQLVAPSIGYYTMNLPSTIVGTPTVSNMGNTAFDEDLYALSISSNILSEFGSLSSTGIGNSIWSGSSLTVGGNIAAINSHLGNLVYTPAAGYSTSAYLQYSLINQTRRNFVTNQTQTLRESASLFLTIPGAYTYDKNVVEQVLNFPQVTNVDGNALGTYIVTVGPNANATSTITTLSSGAYTSNATTKILTLTGNKAAVNALMANVYIQPGNDTVSDISLNWSVTTPESMFTSKTQVLSVANTDTQLSNTTATRYFTSNTYDQLVFANTFMQILDTRSGNYQIKFTALGSCGKFGKVPSTAATFATLDAPVATWTSSLMNRAAMNAFLNNTSTTQSGGQYMRPYFFPTKDKVGAQTFQVDLYKDGGATPVKTAVINYTGTARSTPIAGVGLTAYSAPGTYTYNVTYEMLNYAPTNNLTAVLVAGGGSGGTYAGTPVAPGGGGGAGGVRTVAPFAVTTPTSYSIVIGGGGNRYSGTGYGDNTTGFAVTSIGGMRGYDGDGGIFHTGGNGGDSGAPTAHSGAAGVTQRGGGGGGAGANPILANGGDGLATTITGSTTYLGGGGGSFNGSGSSAGTGGIGGGAHWNTPALTLTAATTGGGGAGAIDGTHLASNGGNGLAYIKFGV